MTYVSWATMYEGETDQAYLDVLLPRIMEEIILSRGVRNSTIPTTPAVRIKRGSVMGVAQEACAAKDAFHLVFFHADTGGRNLEANLPDRSIAYCEAMHAVCEWSMDRCITIPPRHETEAWILADPQAVMAALGFRGAFGEIGLPADANEAETLEDPKAVLGAAARAVRGRRKSINVIQLFSAVAQRQSTICLRRSNSFAAFENSLTRALHSLGCV